MLRFKTILFPVDFSDRCVGAARYVKALRERFDSRVILLHVVETRIGQIGEPQFGGMLLDAPVDLEAEARQALDQFLTEELSGPNVERWIVRGSPASTILAVAREEHADLMVIPTHGYGGLRRILFGSTASTLLHRSPCPVLTGAHLDRTADATEGLEINRILCALDLLAESDKVLDSAAELAARFGAELVLLHVVPGTEALPDRQIDCELRGHLLKQAKEQLLAIASNHGVNATILTEAGSIAPTVENIAIASSADLIVIGRNGEHPWWEHNSYGIARRAPCAVLSI